MLTLDQDYTFTARARVNIAALAGKGIEFDVELHLLDHDRVEQLQQQLKAGDITGLDFARQVLLGWPAGQVRTKDGMELVPTDAHKEQVLRQPGVAPAVIEAFWSGYWPATEGNSAPPSAG